jgi:hypothetical protein
MRVSFPGNYHLNHLKTRILKRKMSNRIKLVENPLLTELSLGESLIELKRVAFIFEKSGDPEVLEELLDTIRDIEIPLLVAGYHIPHEAEA